MSYAEQFKADPVGASKRKLDELEAHWLEWYPDGSLSEGIDLDQYDEDHADYQDRLIDAQRAYIAALEQAADKLTIVHMSGAALERLEADIKHARYRRTILRVCIDGGLKWAVGQGMWSVNQGEVQK